MLFRSSPSAAFAVDIEQFYAMANAALGETPAAIHWDFVLATLQEASGLPQMVGLEVDADVVPPPPPPLPGEVAPAVPPAETPPVETPPAEQKPVEQPAPTTQTVPPETQPVDPITLPQPPPDR